MSIEKKVDRSKWGPGEWDREPHDRIEWRLDGMPCLMVRNDAGAWCGYVAVPAAHPWASMGYDDIDARVHGGLTYGPAPCQPGGAICHVPQPGEGDDVRWVGFDCSHCDDIRPADDFDRDPFFGRHRMYRSDGYVRREVESLARQAMEVA